MITIYPPGCTDFSSNGLGALTPIECTVKEIAGGMYELRLEQPIDDSMRWAQIVNECYIKAPVPMRESPLYEVDAFNGVSEETTTVTRQRYKVKTGGARLNLRSDASLSARILGSYKPGTEVIKLGTSGDWTKVSVREGGAVGYMYSSNLDRVLPDISETVTQTMPVTRTGVTVIPARDQLFRVRSIEPDSAAAVLTAECMHVFYDLRGNLINGSYVPENTAANDAVAFIGGHLLNESVFSFYAPNLTAKISGDYSYKSPVEALLDPDEGIVSQTGAMLVRDNYDVHLLPDQVRDMGVTIRRRKNLNGVRVPRDDTDVVTRIIPVGKKQNGDDLFIPTVYVDSPHIGDYPIIYARRIDYDVKVVDKNPNNETTFTSESDAQARLKAMAEADFTEHGVDLPSYGMEVDFEILADAEGYEDYAPLQAVHLYDTVTVIDEVLGLRVKIRVSGYEWDALAMRYTNMTLGNSQDIQQTVYSYNLPNGGISGTKIAIGTADGAILRNATLQYAKIAVATITQLNANAVTAVTARIQELIAQSITTDDLYAGLAEIAEAHIKTADIGWADIERLTAVTAAIADARIGDASILTAQISDLQAEIATIITLAARQGKFDFAKIQDLLASAMILEEGVAGTVYIRNLIATHANFVGAIIGDLVLQGDDGLYYDVSVQSDGTIYASQRAVTDDELRAGVTADGHQIVATTANITDLNAENIRANSAIIGSIFTQALVAGKIMASEAFLASATVPELYAAAIKAIGDSLDLTANDSIRLMVRDSTDIGTTNLIRINDPEHPVHIYQGSIVANASDEPYRRSLREFQMARISTNYIEFPSPFKVHGSSDLHEKYTLSFWAWSTSSYEDLVQAFAVNLSDMNLYGTKQDAYVGPAFSLGADTSLTATYPTGYVGPVYSIDGNGDAVVSFSDILRCVLVDHNGVEHDVCTGGVGTLNTPERTERTFDIDFTDTVYLRIYSSNVAWSLSDVKIERGSVATGWSANPYEFETIGSEVVINEHEVYIGTERFVVDITNAGQRFTMDETGGSMNYLRVNTLLTAPNMALMYTGPASPTIGSGGTYGTLTEFAEAVNGRTLPFDVTASITETLYETVELGGMHGRGALTIDGDGHTLAGGLTLRNTGVSVTFTDLTVNGTMSLVNGNPVSFSGVTFNGNGGENALHLQSGSLAIVHGCGFYNATNLMRVTPGCWLSAYNSKGGNGTYFLRAERCTVWMDGTRPDGSRNTSCVLSPNDPSNLTIDYGTATPTVTPVTTASFSCAASGTNYNDTHWHGDSRIRQGYYSMTGGAYEQRGCFWFDLSALAGRTIKSAWLTLTRISGYGRSSAVSVKLYTTPLTSESGNPMTSAVDRGTIGTIANGETKQFAIPAAAIGSSATSGFMICVNDGTLMSGRGYSTNYAHFYGYGEANPPVLTITYQ